MIAGEADEALRVAGFIPCGEMPEDGADDEDGILCPPPDGSPWPSGGGIQTTFSQSLLGSAAFPFKLWSTDEATGSSVGFVCALDVMKGVFYAKFKAEVGDPDTERSMKGAINTLFDIAEVCNSRKITLGLCPEYAGCGDFVCSLLYLGFEVVPSSCEHLLFNAALLLDFDIGWPQAGFQSDYTCAATSDCSTSADEDDYQEWSDSDSN